MGRGMQRALAWTLPVLGVLLLSMVLGFFGTGDVFAGPRGVMQHAWWMVLAGVLWWLWGRSLRRGSGRGAREAIGAVAVLAVVVWGAVVMGFVGLIGVGVAGVGWLTVLLLVLLLVGVVRARRAQRGEAMRRAMRFAKVDWRWHGLALGLVLPSAALLLTAAAVPPGALWASEANGYDVLSYHLPVPRAWQMAGRAVVLEHIAYSALPLYAETAYATLSTGFGRLLENVEPRAVVLAAGWHAACALVFAWVVGRCVGAMGSRGDGRFAGLVSGAFVLAVPWVIVTGSLAYNEQLVNMCFAGALLLVVLSSDRLMPSGRAAVRAGAVCLGVMVGLLLGVATGAKPTAFFMAVPTVLVALVASRGWRELVVVCGAAGVAGMLVLMPWLVRNWVEIGNPVFPYATGLFGTGHWTDEQVARWLAAHSPEGGLVDRVAMFFGTRGIGHPQWGVFGLVVVVAGIIASMEARTRRVALVLGTGILLQVLAWLVVGHQQSRFLLAMVVPGAVVVGLACLGNGDGRLARFGRAFAVGGVLVLMVQSWLVYLSQNATAGAGVGGAHIGNPARGLVLGVDGFTGRAFFDELDGLDGAALAEAYAQVGPTVTVNHALGRGITQALARGEAVEPGGLLLVGDATPLYYLEGPGLQVRYATTWDAHPLAEALNTHGGDMGAALAALREQGITHLLVNTNELERLSQSGYLDPALTRDAIGALLRGEDGAARWFVPMFAWFDETVVLLGAVDEVERGRE